MRMKCTDCNYKFVQPRIPAVACPRCGGDYLVRASGGADNEDAQDGRRLLTEIPDDPDNLKG